MKSRLPHTFVLLGALILAPLSSARADDPVPDSAPWTVKTAIQQRDYWPTDDWQVSTAANTLADRAALEALAKYSFSRTGDDTNRVGIRTDGVVVVKNGRIEFEQYARGYTQASRHLSWSTAKSYVNALLGVSVKAGKIKLDDPVRQYVPAVTSATMTVWDVLTMSSGFDWKEDYENNPIDSSTTNMLYVKGYKDMATFTAKTPMLPEGPGKRWYYNSGNSNLLMAALRTAMGLDAYKDLPWSALFDVIGMKNVTFEADQAGTFTGSSYLYATPRDMAKFGFLYLNDGNWDGKQVLPTGWVETTRKVAPAYRSPATVVTDATKDGVYGAHFWLNAVVREKTGKKPYSDVPEDMFTAWGHWGQFIFIIPSLDLVVVRVGDDRDGSFDVNQFLKLVIAAFPTQNGGAR